MTRKRIVIEEQICAYRKKKNIVEQYCAFFSSVAGDFNDLDDGFAFYVDIYDHVDATFRYAYWFHIYSF